MVYIPVQSGCALSVAVGDVALTTAGTRPLLLRTRALPWGCAHPCCFKCMLIIVRGALHGWTQRSPEVRFLQHTGDTLCIARPQLLYQYTITFKVRRMYHLSTSAMSQVREVAEKASHLSGKLY
jgi:hypothetical protein